VASTSNGRLRPPERPASRPESAPPLRAELLALDQLGAAARALAQRQVAIQGSPRPSPLPRLVTRAAVELEEFELRMTAAMRERRSITPATEWLLDNSYLVEEQLRLTEEDFPPAYADILPRLTAGPLEGYPRIYEIAVTLVAHTDSRLDSEVLNRFMDAYQDVRPLDLGEVWAIPIVMRIAFLENVRRLAATVTRSSEAEQYADDWADRLLIAAQDRTEELPGLLKELSRQAPRLAASFYLRLLQRMRDQDERVSPIVSWVERQVEASGVSLETYLTDVQQRRAANQVSIANAITSLRFLGALDWRGFFEQHSFVEQILREDPVGVYDRMDFVSRDRYRHAVEELAKRCPNCEIEVAEAAVSWAREALAAEPENSVKAHVGYFLVSGGRYDFERSLRYRPRLREVTYRGPLRFRGVMYWGSILLVTLLLAALAGWYAHAAGAAAWAAGIIVLLGLLPLSDFAVTNANRIAALLFPARSLLKLDFQHPVEDNHRTLVIAPALLTSAASVNELYDRLEVAYLANTDPNIHFGMVGDLRGAKTEHLPGDAAILGAATLRVEELNERYAGEDGRGPFHLFIRARRFNAEEDMWMGWERKRGAVVELNKQLRGSSDTSFATVAGDASFLRGVTFVITLDADTLLPRDGARKLISAIAHPLNRAGFDPDTRCVVRGYGLVQPHVGMSLPASRKSRFAKLYSGLAGVDPYSGAISDTYQDVFGEGSFTGKGIYEVNVFLAALDGRIPDDTLLSHDLIEGSFLRTGLASDVEVYDDYPSTYLAQTARLHRWVRGDWQTLPWLSKRVPDATGKRYASPLTTLHRWKLLDNLRRSLLAPSLIAFVAAGWYLIPHPTLVWPAFVFVILFAPAYMRVGDLIVFYPRGFSPANAIKAAWGDLSCDLRRSAIALAVLPHQAQVMLDAAGRALWRQFVSHRDMLEWVTAAESELSAEAGLGAYARRMLPASVVASLLLLPAALADPSQLWLIVPAWLTWLPAPFIAWYLSQPLPGHRPVPVAHERATMRRLARKTWRYFDRFVTAEDHWLVPDNFQEDVARVAHRTSPTNIGLQLLSVLTAYDLGYTSVGDLVERVSRTLNAMNGLDLFRGHFYNWYDTTTMEPLRPNYVSTVDSGNLVGHLLALRIGLIEAGERPLLGRQVLAGLADTLELAGEALLADRGTVPPEETDAVRGTLEEMLRRVGIEEPPANLGVWWALLTELDEAASGLRPAIARLGELGELPAATAAAVLDVADEVARHRADLVELAGWAAMLPDVPQALRTRAAEELRPLLEFVPSLTGLASGLVETLASLDRLAADPVGETDEERAAVAAWAAAIRDGIEACRPSAIALHAQLTLAAKIAEETWARTDFKLLYDTGREVFSIGYNAAEGRLDNSYYDMLASECRLASYLAIAKGDVPQRHWFKLARPLTKTDFGYSLISWSASMFEYLMPLLVMRDWPSTLLDGTYHSVVRRQMQYGRQRGVPWGVSESAFNARDAESTYQYQAFGVPGLGLKRGLSEDAVVAPYATLLALPVDLHNSLANLAVLSHQGGEGPFGYYEAIDFTPGRVPAGAERAIVKAYFAHHQGMGLVALGNTLHDMTMQRRFMSDPVVQTAELLLQEKVPQHVEPTAPHVEEVQFVRSVRELPPPVARSYALADTPSPATHFLSNGRYSVMVTNGGGGHSRWNDIAVTRYREDITRDCWGTFIYLKDTGTGHVWSSGFQPTLVTPDEYHVTFSADKAEYRRIDGSVETHTEVIVSPEDDVEVRRVTVTNHGRRPREIEVTSYFEISLADQATDQAHRTFSNLFVETEAHADLGAVLFTRRPRSADEKRLWGLHVVACEATERCAWSCETDRARFLGRLHTPVRPDEVFGDSTELAGRAGAVLDPVCAVRQTVRIAPGESARLQYVTGVAESRERALALARTYGEPRSGQRAADLAWTSSQIELRDLGITPDEAVVFERLASRLVITDAYSRLKVKTPVVAELPMAALWGLGISGDLPIVLVKVDSVEEVPLVRQLLLAHQYWRHKGLAADLVVLNTRPSAYVGELDSRLQLLVRTGHALQLLDKPGGVFIRMADQIDPAIRNLLESVARVTLVGDAGPLLVQLDQRAPRPAPPDPLFPHAAPKEWPAPALARPELAFDNGLGGFDNASGEYVIVLDGEATTPAPWVNVLANEEFGSMVSEAGIGCTWALNSHENRLTTWNNDPVSDGSGESFYVRDEETGEFWSPTLLPVREETPYLVRHGHGYSLFEHESHGIAHLLTYFVPADDPVRVARLALTNTGEEERHLSVTHVVEWSLGSSRSKAQHRVVTAWDANTETLFARNWFNEDFPGRPAFLACDRDVDSFTASRTEFLGRNGWPGYPAAMSRRGLGGEHGRFHDNCGALMTKLTLAPGETLEVTFLLGQSASEAEARDLVGRYRVPGTAERELERVRAWWGELLGTLTVRTPNEALDTMVNGQLLYQTLACRIWGRTALYQSSGAYGFRDQLQDSLALLIAKPEVARSRIVEAARHQFPEGDVLHWWQPVSGRGVRTRISDDRHWLAYLTAEYLARTGDSSVLEEIAPYLEGQPLQQGVDDTYLVPQASLVTATVWEHIIAAMESARPVGEHGLPLIGGGDWNDGMNRVGHLGRGESIWLGWFLSVVLCKIAAVSEQRGEQARAGDYGRWADSLVEAIERDGWDGAWYLRAFFDDGTPLGTREAAECRIDSVAQTWAVISGQGDRGRASHAMAAVEEKLIKWEDGLVQLLTPPFDQMPEDPGYIKGYVPGVRENGGQYTHAALWVVLAYAMLGDGDTAMALLDLLNPVNHAKDAAGCERYKVEPYVIAADVYAVEPHTGRGGWTWYTGSASWFYTVVTANVLGLRVEGDGEREHLVVDPCIPKDWPGFQATYRHGATIYEIAVENPRGVNRGVEQMLLDGAPCEDGRVLLSDDGATHEVRVRLLGA
jgi:cyclic beta-1,2-glucan synthetase